MSGSFKRCQDCERKLVYVQKVYEFYTEYEDASHGFDIRCEDVDISEDDTSWPPGLYCEHCRQMHELDGKTRRAWK